MKPVAYLIWRYYSTTEREKTEKIELDINNSQCIQINDENFGTKFSKNGLTSKNQSDNIST